MRTSRFHWRVVACTALIALLLAAPLAAGGAIARTQAASSHTAGPHRAAGSGKVLMLSTTLDQPSGPGSSLEEQAAVAAGETPVVVTPTQWMAMTAAQFATYDAIVLGDPHCATTTGSITAATANASVWGPLINGDTIVINTDPVFHAPSHAGAQTLIKDGIAFVTSTKGQLGAYIDLSCYYNSSAPFTPVDLLNNAFAPGTTDFEVKGASDNTAHIVTASSALNGLTDADLSGWSYSIHEVFDQYASDFVPLVIDVNGSHNYCAPDGTCGDPYILARGPGLAYLAIDPTSGYPAQTVTITGTNFGTAEPVAIYWDSTSSTPLVTPTAVADGSFVTTITVPSATAGSHSIIAVGQNSGKAVSVSFQVLPSGISVTPTQGYPTQSITVSGSPYRTGEQVNIYWDSTAGTPLATTTAAAGSFVVTTAVPRPATYGTHTIIAVGQSSGTSFSTTFQVRPVLVLTPISATSGATATAKGAGFGATEVVKLTWNAVGGPLLGKTTTNAGGGFGTPPVIRFTVPTTAPGTYQVCAQGQTSGSQNCRKFTVTG